MTDSLPPDAPTDGAGGRRRRLLIAGVVAAIVALAVIVVWFEPQALFVDRRVDDASLADLAAAAPSEGADDVAPPTEPARSEPAVAPSPTEPAVRVLSESAFSGRSRYTVTGDAIVAEVDGQRVLRLEDYESENGPDLVVWLSTAPADAPDDEIETADFVSLGELRGNVGDQNYVIPEDVELADIGSVVIWCRRFSVGFGTAPLEI